MKKFTILLALMGLLLAAIVHAQGSQETFNPANSMFPNIIPPSPTSVALQKYIGYPVSHATGVVDVSMPIYTLQLSGLSIPLELKYHSSGVRVQDSKGIVGLGWTLFPGFKISRTIMGKPDDLFEFVPWRDDFTVEEQIALASSISMEESGIPLQSRPRIDGEYDIFSIHLPGLDASFIMENDNGVYTARTIPERPLNIVPKVDTNAANYNLYAFEVTDDRGIRYSFGPVSHSTPPNLPYMEIRGGSYPCAVGWMLRKITLPNGQEVDFTYYANTETVQALNRTYRVVDKIEDMGSYSGDIIKDYWYFEDSKGWKDYDDSGDIPGTSSYSTLVLKKISSPMHDIEFDHEFIDENNTGLMKSVTIQDKNDKVIRKVTLEQDNRTDLLKKVITSDEGEYLFTYNWFGEGEFNQGLSYYTFDWWGYTNSPNRADSYIPRVYMYAYGTGSARVPIGAANVEREPNATYMTAGALKKITYPTKGEFRITYEPHSFTYGGQNKTGAGLRVKTTELYDPVSDKTVIRQYDYEEPHFTMPYYPDGLSLVKTVTQNKMIYLPLNDGPVTEVDAAILTRARVRSISAFCPHPYFTNNALPVWYGKVTETSAEGRSVFTYAHTTDIYDNNLFPDEIEYDERHEYYPGKINRLVYPAPRLISRTDYQGREGENYTEVRMEKNTYTIRTYEIDGTVAAPFYSLYLHDGVEEKRYGNWNFAEEWSPALEDAPLYYYEIFGNPIRHKRYSITAGNVFLTSTETVTYAGNDSIVERSSYAYDEDNRPYNIRERRQLTSQGDEVVYKYYYPGDESVPGLIMFSPDENNVIVQMEAANYLSTPIQTIVERDGTTLSNLLVKYKHENGMFLPAVQLYSFNGDTPASRIEYKLYDSYGNPRHIVKDGIENIVYLWSYNGQYPVAEIKNATYADVCNMLQGGNNTINALANMQYPGDEYLYNLLKDLRDIYGAQATVFTYNPLVGVSSVTDPSGRITYYYYDAKGRLELVKDEKGKILGKYEYHYQGQQQ